MRWETGGSGDILHAASVRLRARRRSYPQGSDPVTAGSGAVGPTPVDKQDLRGDSNMQQKQWQYGMTIVFGLLMLAIPWVLRFYDDIPIRSWDFYVIGALTAASGAAALHRCSYLAARLVPALGLWMFFSPWIIGFVHNIPARNSAWA